MKKHLNRDQLIQQMPKLFVVAFTIFLVGLLYYFKSVWAAFSNLIAILSPFIIGFGVSFLISPVQSFLNKLAVKTIFRKKNRPRLMNGITAGLSLLFLIVLLSVFMSVVLPQLIRSISSIVHFITRLIKMNEDSINSILMKYKFLHLDEAMNVSVAWENIVSGLTGQLDTITSLVGNVLAISGSVVNVIYTIFVSFITAFYILMDKDMIAARFKKTGYSIFTKSTMDTLVYWTRRATIIFTGFISGKILDSLIIAVICYIGMVILQLPYQLLIACIIGVTNIIPFFGPFIGWIPCALILFMINPLNALWFTIFIIILQQLDGNIIGPHILGDYVGVSAFSIMVVIIIGGGLFGFVGMLLAVPVYALLNAICNTLVDNRLKSRGFSAKVTDYINYPVPQAPSENNDTGENNNAQNQSTDT